MGGATNPKPHGTVHADVQVLSYSVITAIPVICYIVNL